MISNEVIEEGVGNLMSDLITYQEDESMSAIDEMNLEEGMIKLIKKIANGEIEE